MGEKYNYKNFSFEKYNFDKIKDFEKSLKVPNFELKNISNKSERLLNFSEKFLVLETGSITCPLFQGKRDEMIKLMNKYKNIKFVVLYVREAHPGNKIPSHSSLNNKIDYAKKLKEKREILIDDLNGTAHSFFNNYPNSIFIISKKGEILYNADWNNIRATEKAIKKIIEGKSTKNIKSYFFPVNPRVLIKVLKKSGDSVLKEFILSLPKLIWSVLIKKNLKLLFNLK